MPLNVQSNEYLEQIYTVIGAMMNILQRGERLSGDDWTTLSGVDVRVISKETADIMTYRLGDRNQGLINALNRFRLAIAAEQGKRQGKR